jgi:hypothetical protein
MAASFYLLLVCVLVPGSNSDFAELVDDTMISWLGSFRSIPFGATCGPSSTDACQADWRYFLRVAFVGHVACYLTFYAALPALKKRKVTGVTKRDSSHASEQAINASRVRGLCQG